MTDRTQQEQEEFNAAVREAVGNVLQEILFKFLDNEMRGMVRDEVNRALAHPPYRPYREARYEFDNTGTEPTWIRK